MPIKISILGLRKVGVSAAKALSEVDDRFVILGWDPDEGNRTFAKQQKTFQSIPTSIPKTVRQADIMFLFLPPDEFETNAGEICRSISKETIILNLTNLHAQSAIWIQKYLPNTTRYVSLFPTMNPAVILSDDFDKKKPNANLFKDGYFYILDPLKAEKTAIDRAIDLCVLMGGRPIFADASEIDGLISTNVLFPHVAAASLMTMISEQPGWREGKNVAGRALNIITSFLQDKSEDGFDPQTVFYQRENISRQINEFIKHLIKIRESLTEAESKEFTAKMRAAEKMRKRWIENRKKPLPTRMLTSSIPDKEQALKRIHKFYEI